jgi:hypothetical protein
MLNWAPTTATVAQAGGISGNYGTFLTSGAADTKGASWATVATASRAWECVAINLNHQTTSADFLVDVAISSGNFIFAPDLHIPGGGGWAAGVVYVLPVRIPSGATVVARAACSSATSQCAISVRGISGGLWGMGGFSRCMPLFTPATGSRGPTVDAGATINTKIAYQQLSAGIAYPVGAVIACVGPAGDFTRVTANWLVDIGAGSVGNQRPILSNIGVSASSTVPTIWPHVHGPIPCDVAASTVWWARTQCSINTAGDRTLDVCLYGLI